LGEQVGVFGMALEIRGGIRAAGENAPALGAGSLQRFFGQLGGDAASADFGGYTCMKNDHGIALELVIEFAEIPVHRDLETAEILVMDDVLHRIVSSRRVYWVQRTSSNIIQS